jgi:steroid 5-alpha reductase family enzyme
MFRNHCHILIFCIVQLCTSDALIVVDTLHSRIRRHHHHHHPKVLQNTPARPSWLAIRGGSDENVVAAKTGTDRFTSTSIAAIPLSSFVPSVVTMGSLIRAWMTSTLQTGPFGVVALTVLSSAICVPITQYKNLYGISVGYGLSVAVIATVLRNVFVFSPWSIPDVISGAALFYGLRLALFLWFRDVSGARSLDSTKKSGRLQRLPFAISLALFYAFMMTPLLYAMRNPVVASSTNTAPWKVCVAWTGCGLAWVGAIMEAIADAHKYVVKGRSNENATTFCGPTQGSYAITRHPNYTGEVIFWLGAFLAGLPSFGNSIVAYVCSISGLYGIISIMRGATKSLEKKQVEKYGGQPKYENWKKKVPVSLVPLL